MRGNILHTIQCLPTVSISTCPAPTSPSPTPTSPTCPTWRAAGTSATDRSAPVFRLEFLTAYLYVNRTVVPF